MSEAIIVVEGLSKCYAIDHNLGAQVGYKRYTSLRDVIGQQVRNFTCKALAAARGRRASPNRETEEFWALKNLNFEVKRGEVLGIIGRNGAGKSTLLKILSRITEPTVGRVILRGRVASLLEVGTGFHPELTGRENIHLNGAILGMSRAEIRKKFDEIVTFAGVEKFLDTPVKRYSSGMYVRLAFAVAAHLEPEILLVDEVLAVGDAEFQKKCLGKIDEVSRREGRTVLLVSHNMAAIAEMANRALLLDAGSVVIDGTVPTVVSTYLARGARRAAYIRPVELDTSVPHIARIEVITSDPNAVHRFGEPLEIKFWIRHPSPMMHGSFCFQIFSSQFQIPVIHSSYYDGQEFGSESGCSTLLCQFPRIFLNVGEFYLCTYLQDQRSHETYEYLEGICVFEVIRVDENQIAGWRPEVCAYHEQHAWTMMAVNTSADFALPHVDDAECRANRERAPLSSCR
ncbi:MAG: ATP-binding cassette domain-containing protein [Deltaproteobacteria bacterium]|nr:ATP-binding cassette domain-containing protein [Deltaproteobacteria bacterium]